MTSREVIARSGPFRWRIEIDGIESIHPSRSLDLLPSAVARPAGDPLRRRPALLVSPEDREGFLQAMVERSRHLHRAGEQVRRV